MKKVAMILIALSMGLVLFSGTAKVAWVHHANQSFADNHSLALRVGDSGYAGNSYHRVLDTHEYYNLPVDLHISGPLMQSYAFLQNDNGLLLRMRGSLVDIVGGFYAENIIPYAEEDMNRFAAWYEIVTDSALTKKPGWNSYPTVVWIPERVFKNESQMPYSLIAVLNAEYGKRDEFGNWVAPCIILDDNVHAWYAHTFPDGTQCNNSHKVHIMYDNWGNYVYIVFICSIARNNWVWNDVSVPGQALNEHLWNLHQAGDQEQICLYGDDWEKAAGVAGWDFGSPGAPSNSYDHNLSWAKNQSWIQPVHICEVAKWWGHDRIHDANPLNDPPRITIQYSAYPELHGWTGGNYDNWYYDFKTTQAYGCSLSYDLNGNGIRGDYEDLWKWARSRLLAAPDNRINKLGWVTLMGMLYETAWHAGPGGPLIYWGKNLWGHTRMAGYFAAGAEWLNSLPSQARIDSADYDGDGIIEYAIMNDKICAFIERRGGRIVALFTSDGDCIVGNLMTNWGTEGDENDGGHQGLFEDSQGENSWFDVVVNIAGGTRARLTLLERFDRSGNPSTDLYKTLTLDYGYNYISASYSSRWTNWTKSSVCPDIWDQLLYGYSLSPISGLSGNGWMYGGYENTRTGAKGVFLWGSGRGLVYHDLARMSSGAHLIEIGGVQGNYTVYFYAGRGRPDIETIGPGDREGPIFTNRTQTPAHSIIQTDSVLITVRTSDPSGCDSAGITYTINNWTSSVRVRMIEDDGAAHDWNGDNLPTENLWGGYIPPYPNHTVVAYYLWAYDGLGNVGYDSNYGSNYVYVVGQITFVMDGYLDRVAQLLASNGGMHLWAYWYADSSILYLATESAGGDAFNNDHFIFVSYAPISLRSSPWAKAGRVGVWLAFMGDENDNKYVAWFDSAGTLLDTVHISTGRFSGGVTEGTIRLTDFGSLPSIVYIAAASYATANGGVLQWQVPGDGYPPDGNIDQSEFYPLSIGTVSIKEPISQKEPQIRVYPNPFVERVDFILPVNTLSKISIYNISGQVIKEIEGSGRLIWDGKDGKGNEIPAGIYFYRFRQKGVLRSGRIIKLN